MTARARVLVLRDKQAAILPEVSQLFAREIDSESDELTSAETMSLARALTEMSGVAVTVRDVERHFSELELAALIAKRMLDLEPPVTSPEWATPWPEMERYAQG